MTITNFHAHSTFCDGAETCEAMVTAAISKGCLTFGISGHAGMGFDTDWCMSETGTTEYIREMDRLKKAYAGTITIFTGLEQDYYSPAPKAAFDYIIGSVHYIRKNGAYLLVDESEAVQRRDVEQYYGGDFYGYTKEYFQTVAGIVPQTRPDFIGHFDLVTKFNEGGKLFDETDPRYINPALEALTAITESHKLFEINTGAMYRVGRSSPYPSARLLKELRAHGGEIILSSDSHDGASIGFRFDEAVELAKSCGFKYAKTLTDKGFVDYRL